MYLGSPQTVTSNFLHYTLLGCMLLYKRHTRTCTYFTCVINIFWDRTKDLLYPNVISLVEITLTGNELTKRSFGWHDLFYAHVRCCINTRMSYDIIIYLNGTPFQMFWHRDFGADINSFVPTYGVRLPYYSYQRGSGDGNYLWVAVVEVTTNSVT